MPNMCAKRKTKIKYISQTTDEVQKLKAACANIDKIIAATRKYSTKLDKEHSDLWEAYHVLAAKKFEFKEVIPATPKQVPFTHEDLDIPQFVNRTPLHLNSAFGSDEEEWDSD